MTSRTALGRTQRGVSLIETGLVAGLVTVAVTAGVPSFTQMRDTQTLQGASSQLVHDLQYVRTEAVARNLPLRLTTQPLPSGGACYVIHTGASGSCQCAADATAVCAGGEQVIKASAFGHGQQVRLAVNSTSMLWHPERGTVSPAGTVRLTLPDGRAIHHVVNIMGRARTCSPDGAMKGHRTC